MGTKPTSASVPKTARALKELPNNSASAHNCWNVPSGWNAWNAWNAVSGLK